MEGALVKLLLLGIEVVMVERLAYYTVIYTQYLQTILIVHTMKMLA